LYNPALLSNSVIVDSLKTLLFAALKRAILTPAEQGVLVVGNPIFQLCIKIILNQKTFQYAPL